MGNVSGVVELQGKKLLDVTFHHETAALTSSVLSDVNDPSLVGKSAPEGSLLMYGAPGDGRLYLKLGSQDTDWARIPTVAESAGFKNVFDVTDFGAIGVPDGQIDDGTVNDTAAIRAAEDAAVNAGGGAIYFPGKCTYIFRDRPEVGASALIPEGSRDSGLGSSSSKSRVKVMWFGDPDLSSKIKMTGNGKKGDWYMFDLVSNNYELRFMNLTLDGDEVKGTWTFNRVDEHENFWSVPAEGDVTTTFTSKKRRIHGGTNGILVNDGAGRAFLSDPVAAAMRVGDEGRSIRIVNGQDITKNVDDWTVGEVFDNEKVLAAVLAPQDPKAMWRIEADIPVVGQATYSRISNPGGGDIFSNEYIGRDVTFFGSALDANNRGINKIISIPDNDTVVDNAAAVSQGDRNNGFEGGFWIDNSEAGPLVWEILDEEDGYLKIEGKHSNVQSFPADVSQFVPSELGPQLQSQRMRWNGDWIVRLNAILDDPPNRGAVGFAVIADDDSEYVAFDYDAHTFTMHGKDANGPFNVDGMPIVEPGRKEWLIRHLFGVTEGQDAGVPTGDGASICAGTPTVIKINGSKAVFTDAMVGAKIRLVGCANEANNGLFTITKHKGSMSIEITNPNAISETSSFFWQVEGGTSKVTFESVDGGLDIKHRTESDVLFTPGKTFIPILYHRTVAESGDPVTAEVRSFSWQDSGCVKADEQTHIINARALADTKTTGQFDIERCFFKQSVGDAVRVLGSGSGQRVGPMRIRDCMFVDCGRGALSVQRASEMIEFTRNYCVGGTDQLVDFEPSGDIAPRWFRIAGNIFDNRRQSNSQAAITLTGNQFAQLHRESLFTDNILLYCAADAINIGSLLLSNNVWLGPISPDKQLDMVSFDASLYGLRIIGNYMRQVSDLTTFSPIKLQNREMLYPKRVAIQNNHIISKANDTNVIETQGLSGLLADGNLIEYGGGPSKAAAAISQRNIKAANFNDVSQNSIVNNHVRSFRGGLELFYRASVVEGTNGGTEILVANNNGGEVNLLVQFQNSGWDTTLTPLVSGNAMRTTSGLISGYIEIGGRLAIGGNMTSAGHTGLRIFETDVATPNGKVVGKPGDLLLTTQGAMFVKASGVNTNMDWVAIGA